MPVGWTLVFFAVCEPAGALAPPVAVPASASALVTGTEHEARQATQVSRASRVVFVGQAKRIIIVVRLRGELTGSRSLCDDGATAQTDRFAPADQSRSALGPPSSTTWAVEARRGREYTDRPCGRAGGDPL